MPSRGSHTLYRGPPLPACAAPVARAGRATQGGFGIMAQLVAHLPCMQGVGSSSLPGSTQTGHLRDVRTRRTMHERGSLAQSVSALPCHGRGRGFESRRNRSVPDGSTAEHPTVNRQVAGSNPARGARDSSVKEDPADVVAAPVLKTDCLKGRASSTLASSAPSAVRCWLRTRALNSDGAGSSPAGGARRTVKL